MIALGFGLAYKANHWWAGLGRRPIFSISMAVPTCRACRTKADAHLLQRLLADRFQLKFHREQRELAGLRDHACPWRTQDEKPPRAQRSAGIWIQRARRPGCDRNMSRNRPSRFPWDAVIRHRPAHRGSNGIDRDYDFQLKWTPDDSQFAQFRGRASSLRLPVTIRMRRQVSTPRCRSSSG